MTQQDVYDAWAPAASHLVRVAGYLAVARTVVAMTRQSVRFRFLVGFTGLLLAVAAVLVQFALCVVGSRALLTVLSRQLRSRRAKDLGIVLVALTGIAVTSPCRSAPGWPPGWSGWTRRRCDRSAG